MISCDCKIENVYAKYGDEVVDVNMHWCPQHGAASELLEALQMVLPIAAEYLKAAPSHPDNAKLETARAAIGKACAR